MDKKNIELFFEELSKNEVLRGALAKVESHMSNFGELTKNEQEKLFNKELLPILHEHGFDFSYNDLCEYNKSKMPADGTELSNEFLDQVTGGWGACFVAGFTGDGVGACVLVGVTTKDGEKSGTDEYPVRCVCVLGGGGLNC